MRLHSIVVVDRCFITAFYDDFGPGNSALCIATLRLHFCSAHAFARLVNFRIRRFQRQYGSFLIIFYMDQPRGAFSHLVCFRDNHGYMLSIIKDALILQRQQILFSQLTGTRITTARWLVQARGIFVSHNAKHAFHSPGFSRIQYTDAAFGDGALH